MEWMAALIATLFVGLLYYRYPKIMLILTGVLISAIALISSIFAWRHVQMENMISSVVTKGGLESRCDWPKSLYIVSKNNTKKIVVRRRVTIKGFRPGYSDVVYSGTYVSDKIINPDESWGECVSLPGKAYGYEGYLPDKRRVKWTIELSSANFMK